MQGLNDKAITLDMLNSAKQAVLTYSNACNETSNQNLRSILQRQLQEALETQQQLSQFAQQQGYYKVNETPQQAITQTMQELSQGYNQQQQTQMGSYNQQQRYMSQQYNPYHN
ncbi:hypothetical protein GGQ84_000189 [Desulfitispora alkaliphila]|uniref:spore coat protein n=1 Tax=Desulfitispora alkaliphila TaxID=622674 RepID=UPI003D1D3156